MQFKNNKKDSKKEKPPKSKNKLNDKPPYLFPQTANDKKYTLIMDLDETLIHYDDVKYFLVVSDINNFI